MKDTSEKVNLNVLGQTLELIWKSGPVKTLFPFLCVFFVFCFVFSFRINPLYSFILFSVFMVVLFLYLAVLLLKRPELFQDSKTWLGFQKMLYGDKQLGLKELPDDLKLYQPIMKKEAKPANAKIDKGEVIQK